VRVVGDLRHNGFNGADAVELLVEQVTSAEALVEHPQPGARLPASAPPL
jgi:hypothetical protein